MQICLIRHTSVDMPKGTCYGQTNVPLAGTFEQEANEVAQKIKAFKAEIVFSSPSDRCMQLAEKIFSQKIIADKRLMELNFGEWEMKRWDDITGPVAQRWMNDYVNLPCPGGEAYLDLCQRVQLFYNDLSATKAGKVAIVTHAGVIRAFLSIIKQITPEKTFIEEVPFGFVTIFET